MRTSRCLWTAGLLGAVTLAQAGCAEILGLLDRPIDDDGGSGQICKPGAVEECPYNAPAETKGIGVCKAGTRTCLEDGSGYGPCVGEVTPTPEDCGTGTDENCDGEVNEAASGCLCTPDAITACYSGPDGTAGVGMCKTGTGMCNAAGTGYGSCEGEVLPAAEDCANPADENCDSYDCVLHAGLYGDADQQYAWAVAIDRATDSYYVVGRLEGTMAVQGTTLSEVAQGEGFVLKFAAGGELLWGKTIGNALYQIITAVAVDDEGNVAIGGQSSGTAEIGDATLPSGFFVAKLDPEGTLLWATSIGAATGSAITSVAFSPDGDVLCAGHFLGTLDFGDGGVDANVGLVGQGTDGFVGKLRGSDGSGKQADGGWLKTFGDEWSQAARGVRADSAGNVLVVGDFEGSISLGGVSLSSAGNRDVVLAKLDPDGDLLWQLRLGDSQEQYATGLAVDSLGAPIIAGTLEGTVDFGGSVHSVPAGVMKLFVAKYTSSQLPEWSKTFASGGYVTIAVDDKDNVLVSGGFKGAILLGGPVLSAQGTDVFVAKLTASGSLSWNKRFGDDAWQSAAGIDATSTGELVVVGAAEGTIDFGMGPLTAKGPDIFVAKLGQ